MGGFEMVGEGHAPPERGEKSNPFGWGTITYVRAVANH